MSTSARENILAYIAARLETIVGVTVYRTRGTPVARDEGTVLILQPEEEKIRMLADDLAVRDLIVLVTAFIQGAAPDSLLDPVLQKIQSAVMGDNTLGGLATRVIEHETQWKFETTDVTVAAIELRYLVKYLTPAKTVTLA